MSQETLPGNACSLQGVPEQSSVPARSGVAVQSCECVSRRRVGPISITLAVSLAVALGYAAIERVGTRANVDEIEYTTNIAGGFLAVGFTGDQPGFVLLSEIDRKKVEVSADLSASVVAGSRTHVHIHTPQSQWHKRLRTPQLIIVREDGSITDEDVNWGFEEFTRIRTASDCSHEGGGGSKRCGAPFADLHDLVSAGKLQNVSDEVRAFLGRFQQD